MRKWNLRGLLRAFVIFVASAMILSLQTRNTGAYLEDNAELDITIRYNLSQPGNDKSGEPAPTDTDAQASEPEQDNGEDPTPAPPQDNSSSDEE